jgi:hypothetical protein
MVLVLHRDAAMASVRMMAMAVVGLTRETVPVAVGRDGDLDMELGGPAAQGFLQVLEAGFQHGRVLA